MSLAKSKINILLDKLSETEIFAIMLVVEELTRSKDKHPTFADDSMTLAASIISEECGEMCRAVNQYVQEDGTTTSNIMVEASHTAVTAIRLIEMVDKMSTGVNDSTCVTMNAHKQSLRIIENMLRDGKDEFDILTKLKLMFDVKRRK